MKKVSIITVNYNGRSLLPNFLNSVRNLDYSKNKIETIVVDNASSDDSVTYLSKHYPWVKIIESRKNLGFGGGNNLGIIRSSGDYILLVNNDTKLDKRCVREMASCIESKKKGKNIGAVAAKLLLYDKYLPLNIRNAKFHNYQISRKNTGYSVFPFVIKSQHRGIDEEKVYIPVNHDLGGSFRLRIIVRNLKEGDSEIVIGDRLMKQFNFKGETRFESFYLNIDANILKKEGVDLLQNAGNQIFRDGYGRDRGSLIISNEQYYEVDTAQYDNLRDLKAFCGAGVMLKRRALESAGLFDENFFMYYEDDDLSFRIRKKGWEILYCPNAVIRHIHSATSKEWSPKFKYNVERGRLLFVIKHWPRFLVFIELVKYVLIKIFITPLGHLLFGEFNTFLAKLNLRLRVLKSLTIPLLGSVFVANRISYKEVKQLS